VRSSPRAPRVGADVSAGVPPSDIRGPTQQSGWESDTSGWVEPLRPVSQTRNLPFDTRQPVRG